MVLGVSGKLTCMQLNVKISVIQSVQAANIGNKPNCKTGFCSHSLRLNA